MRETVSNPELQQMGKGGPQVNLQDVQTEAPSGKNADSKAVVSGHRTIYVNQSEGHASRTLQVYFVLPTENKTTTDLSSRKYFILFQCETQLQAYH